MKSESLTAMISVSCCASFSDTLRSLELWVFSAFSAGKLSIPWYPELVNKMPASILTFEAKYLD